MSSVVQSSTRLGFAGNASVNLTLNGVQAGNSIIVVCAGYGDANGPTISANDGSAYSSIQGRRASSGSSATAAILWLHNVSAGNKTITVSTDSSALFRYGWARAMEVSGLANAAPNVTMPAASGANGANSNAPSTGNSAATTVANCFVVAALSVSGGGTDAGIDTPATTGYTNWWVSQDFNAEQAGAGDYKVVTATGAQSAAWGTLSGSYPWAAALAAFEEASSGSTFNIVPQAAMALAGSVAMAGDLEVDKVVQLQPVGGMALAGSLSLSGDLSFLQPVTFDLEQVGSMALSGPSGCRETLPHRSRSRSSRSERWACRVR